MLKQQLPRDANVKTRGASYALSLILRVLIRFDLLLLVYAFSSHANLTSEETHKKHQSTEKVDQNKHKNRDIDR